MCFQINWYYQTLNILWEQFNEFPNAFNKTVVLSNCFRQAILVCIYCMEQNSFCCYIQTYITILEMSQKQIKIIPLKLLDNKLFKFLILSFKISIDNVIHYCSLGGIMFAPVNGADQTAAGPAGPFTGAVIKPYYKRLSCHLESKSELHSTIQFFGKSCNAHMIMHFIVVSNSITHVLLIRHWYYICIVKPSHK